METTEKANSRTLKAWFDERKLGLLAYLLVLALLVVMLWPFVTMTVEAGYVGVYYSRLFGGTQVDWPRYEGLHFLLPWDKIICYNARAQSMDFEILTLTKGGLDVTINMSVIWCVKKHRVGELHATMGPNYAETIIKPSVTSVVRSIVGSYAQDLLYDGNPLQMQEDVMKLLSETLQDAPFGFDAILIREVVLPDQMSESINHKFVAEQNVLAERYKVLESVERYKRSYVDAEAVRFAQSIVNEGMSEAYLRYLGIEATKQLAQSANAKLVIIGDKDGLPLIMNADSLSTSETLPEGIPYEEKLEVASDRIEEFGKKYDEIADAMPLIDSARDYLMAQFPEANSATIDTTLPQANTVPKTGAAQPAQDSQTDTKADEGGGEK